MAFPPGIYENDGARNLPLGDSSDTPAWVHEVTTPLRQENNKQESNGNTNFTVKFEYLTFCGTGDGTDCRVLLTQNGPSVVRWISNASVEIQKAVWQTSLGAGNYTTIREVDTSVANVDSDMKYLPTEGINKKGLSLPVNSLQGDESEYIGWNMYILINWTTKWSKGSTRSGVFTVTNEGRGSPGLTQKILQLKEIKSSDPQEDQGKEILSDTISPTNNATTTESPGSSTPANSLSASPKSEGGKVDGGGGGGGGGGLDGGAIAGVVVGSVLGLALIAFLAWFFLRRRRRASRSSKDGYGPGPHEYLADKDTHARVTESPHSPYSDDGQHPRPMSRDQEAALPPIPTAGAAASTSSPTNPRNLTHYNEGEHTPTATRSVDNIPRPTDPRSSTPNVNSNVSHLIEDGMTEDEIRRLEEEERALDDAIEQHGSGQGQRR